MNSLIYGIVVTLLACAACAAENASTAGEVLPEPPTLCCLAVRWPIQGDANSNAAVNANYRKKGDAAWKQAYPLLRTYADPDPSNETPAVRVKNGWMFAGSIVDLAPETEYEVKLELNDPDGGSAERLLSMKTIGEPKEPPGMRVRHVIPGEGGGDGSERDPFQGLPAALAASQPGDLFLLHRGTYKTDKSFDIKTSGQPDKPIIYRGAGDGEAILDGGGTFQTKGRLVSANATRHIWMEDLTFQGRQYAIVASESSHWVLRRCTFRDFEKGFWAQNGTYERSRGHFISDNTFTGSTTWPRSKGIEEFYAISITGAGHTVCYNRMQNMADSVHGTDHGNLSASDFYNNDIELCTDDGLETDYGETNLRVFRNRFANVIHGVSMQPAKGGPIYVFRNAIYNATYSPFKLHNHTSGVLLFHNTCLRNGPCFIIQPGSETVTNVWTRNNLFLGTSGNALNTTGRMQHCNFDNDGYGGDDGVSFARWNGKTVTSFSAAKPEGLYSRGAHFVDPKTCFASGLLPPADPKLATKAAGLDFQLSPASGAIDRGVLLPGFNDAFSGEAPDLGCIELGQPAPHYGPRPRVH